MPAARAAFRASAALISNKEQTALDLTGVDLSGKDLTGVNLLISARL
jgi:uncharacterized protein YjbI with pentapeptide repeats